MVKFRLVHRMEMQRIAEEEGILKESQVRETEHIDVFTCPKTYAEAKENLRIWKAAMPNESSSFGFVDAAEAISVRVQSMTDECSPLSGLSGRDHVHSTSRALVNANMTQYSYILLFSVSTPRLTHVIPTFADISPLSRHGRMYIWFWRRDAPIPVCDIAPSKAA